MTPEKAEKFDESGMFRGSHGAFFLMPQSPDKTDYLIALQKPYPDLGRAEFAEILSDECKFRAFFDDGYDDWPQYIRQAIDNTREDTRWVWPIRALPRLPSWISPGGRVVLIGDSAHAIPPASGQGANLAFEDGYTLGLILGSGVAYANLDDGLEFWSKLRNERIDQVRDLTMALNKARLPNAERQKLAKGEAFEAASTEEGRIKEFAWIFGGVPPQEAKIRAWISQRASGLPWHD
jgi:2-polyprenyl-6-methoxyphenol hydroxylase-like FAD-dependent oxidoreductase